MCHDLGCFVESQPKRYISGTRENNFLSESLWSFNKDFSVLDGIEIIEEILEKNAVLWSLTCVNKLLLILPRDWAVVTEL